MQSARMPGRASQPTDAFFRDQPDASPALAELSTSSRQAQIQTSPSINGKVPFQSSGGEHDRPAEVEFSKVKECRRALFMVGEPCSSGVGEVSAE